MINHDIQTEEYNHLHRFRSKVMYHGLEVINSQEFLTWFISHSHANVAKIRCEKRRDKPEKKDLQRYESLEDGRWMKRKIQYAIMAHVFTPNNRHFTEHVNDDDALVPIFTCLLVDSSLFLLCKRYNLHTIKLVKLKMKIIHLTEILCYSQSTSYIIKKNYE